MIVIYCSTNSINGKQYVGQTSSNIGLSLTKRHLRAKTRFGNALRKHGVDSFSWKILDSAEDREESNRKEIFWIDLLKTLSPNGYNLDAGGSATSGWKSNEVSIRARIIAQTGMKKKPCSSETKKKISETKRNNKVYCISDKKNLDLNDRVMKLIVSILLEKENLNIEEISKLLRSNFSISDYELRRKITYYVNKLESLSVVKEVRHPNVSSS